MANKKTMRPFLYSSNPDGRFSRGLFFSAFDRVKQISLCHHLGRINNERSISSTLFVQERCAFFVINISQVASFRDCGTIWLLLIIIYEETWPQYSLLIPEHSLFIVRAFFQKKKQWCFLITCCGENDHFSGKDIKDRVTKKYFLNLSLI